MCFFFFSTAEFGVTGCIFPPYTTFHIYDLFQELSGLRVPCGCDCFGVPSPGLSLLGERSIHSLEKKATELHLRSDRGMKCHKQLLHRQPAVTMAVEPAVLWQETRTIKEYLFEM